jgi:addiction module RelE/StbE family toxin
LRNGGLPVRWSRAAAADLDSIFAYLAEERPDLAEEFVQELLLAADSLEAFPYRGRPGRVPGTRELVALSPYIVVYEVTRGGVLILRLWHGRQDRG